MATGVTTRRRQAEQRRVQLIDTALEVFAAKGVEGATIKDLAEASGVAQGLLYHYFRSKDDLLRAILERHYFLPELRLITSPDRDRSAAEVLLELTQSFVSMLREHKSLLQVMIREAPSNPAITERIERARGEGVRLLAAYLDSRVSVGELRPHDTDATARLVLYAAFMASVTDTPADTFLPPVVGIVLHGIAAPDTKGDAS